MHNLQKTKKILFLTATLFQGGGERIISDLSSYFPKHIQTELIVYENKISYPFNGKIFSLDIPISTNFFLRIYGFFLRLLKIKKIIIQERPDYIVSFGNSANIMNILLNSRSIVRLDTFSSKANKDILGRFYKLFVRLFFKRAEFIISVSRVAAQDLTDNFNISRDKIKVIYNPVNIKKIEELSQESLDEKYEKIFNNQVIITMGRLSREKGQQYLIRAFREVKNSIKDSKLVILGEGNTLASLQKLVKELKIEDSVYFLGWQKNPFPFLIRSKVFVLPSLWEGLPGALLESMVCGVPVVSVDCKSGPREILAPSTDYNFQTKGIEYAEYGILVPVFGEKSLDSVNLTDEEKILSEAIIEVCSNKTLSSNLSKKAKKRTEDFEMQKIIQEWNLIL